MEAEETIFPGRLVACRKGRPDAAIHSESISYLPKPFTPAALLAKVRDALEWPGTTE